MIPRQASGPDGRRSGSPGRAPVRPAGAPGPPARGGTGLDFKTAWARTAPARAARAVLLQGVISPTVRALARPVVWGDDRLDGLGAPVIFAANHHSHLDTGLILTVLPSRFRRRVVVAAAADYFFDRRAKGALHALTFSAVPVERNRVNRRSADLIAELLRCGWSLIIFPEGGRSPDGWGQSFRGGAAYLALRTQRPVVPVFLEGTGRLWPKGQRLPRPDIDVRRLLGLGGGTGAVPGAWRGGGVRVRPGEVVTAPHRGVGAAGRGRRRPAAVSVTFGAGLRPADGEDARRFSARIERSVAALADERSSDWWSASRRAADGGTPPLTGPAAAPWRRAWALHQAAADSDPSAPAAPHATQPGGGAVD